MCHPFNCFLSLFAIIDVAAVFVIITGDTAAIVLVKSQNKRWTRKCVSKAA